MFSFGFVCGVQAKKRKENVEEYLTSFKKDMECWQIESGAAMGVIHPVFAFLCNAALKAP